MPGSRGRSPPRCPCAGRRHVEGRCNGEDRLLGVPRGSRRRRSARISHDMVAALKKAGTKVKYTEYPGVGHHSWTKAYEEPGLPEWLFSQHQ